ncbi:MAG: glycosyltransferase [Candidatus Erginobacter occultus]|nr:glycosyltransferase [Candidatus Erginobacter occultus]
MELKTDTIEVSIIVPVGREDVSRCLDSLRRQTLSRDLYEIILVSHRPLTVRAEGDLVCLVVPAANPSAKRNAGARAARGGVLALIDDDAWAREDWLETGLAYLREHPEAAGVGGPRILPPGSSFREKASDVIAHSKFFGNGHYNWPEMEPRDKIPHGIINSCNCFIRKDVFSSLNGFNEVIGIGGEDTEFFFRASHQSSHCFAYTWKIVVYHTPRRIGWGLFKQRYRYRVQNGKLLWVHPSIYLSRATFSVGLFGISLFILLSLLEPLVFPLGIGFYFALAFAVSAGYGRYDWRFPLVLPPIFFLHHAVYYIAIWRGILTIFTNPNEIRRLRNSSGSLQSPSR